MRVPQLQRNGDLGFNMTPMIDVVFLLIIFFLVSSHLARQEAQLALPLPIAESGAELSAASRVIVNVTRDGRLQLAGRPVAAEQLVARLAEARATHGELLEVKIRTDRQVAYAEVQPILLACNQAGIGNISFGVYRAEDLR